MYEVEVKVRADHETVESALDGAGAEFVDSVIQEDTYYDAPHRNFAETDEALRIRREREPEAPGDAEAEDGTETTKITYKGPLLEAESKSREEHETSVADREAVVGIFDGLGFEPAATVRKERAHYRLDGYTVTLDSVDGLGEFVEVETETEDDDIEAAREGARAVLDDLGLDPTEQIRTSYLGLLLADDASE
ncbi:adenylate cyclase [Halosimplex carlsbadense 2-9-1]|uniref:Adenylate cyclase n=1 Tax=Halosimplex carlsbadense 2-9-1 TaxID=797114 RepID=M0CP29_9EURY|nr:class IV adenylate cyclase [Halosimplex carlsbadense]ELZ25000.1 adenylate cyclase [Halosimplex carlsbadense 2-9-1]